MGNKLIGKCPVCSDNMKITQLECGSCHTAMSGNFRLDKFSRLSEEQLKFVEVFIRSRGNIKEVEREMGISYPTVRNKLDEVVEALGQDEELNEETEHQESSRRKEILNSLEEGEIDSSRAIELLGQL